MDVPDNSIAEMTRAELLTLILKLQRMVDNKQAEINYYKSKLGGY